MTFLTPLFFRWAVVAPNETPVHRNFRQKNMAIDTLALRSPKINHGLADWIENQLILKQGIQLSTGEILYEITSGSLLGSYDSRISVAIKREEYRNISGRPELYPCDPFIEIEASVHKVFFGQNIYGGFECLQEAADRFIDLIGFTFCKDIEALPSVDLWQVSRVDWAEMFNLKPEAIKEFFRRINHSKFPRRSEKSAKYGTNAAYFPGSTTTVKLYHKGSEFKLHDLGRLRHAITFMRNKRFPRSQDYQKNYEYVERKLKALQRLADKRLRVEVELHARILRDIFNESLPFVKELTTDKIKEIYDKELFKLLREGKSDMETVRTHDKVLARLNNLCTSKSSKTMFSFWVMMVTSGEDVVRSQYSESQFYANRKKLQDMGISWHQSDIAILPDQETALPNDFQPIRTDIRRVHSKVRNDSIFNLCPSIYQEYKEAA